MKKSDLKTGHIVKLRNGGKYVVWRDLCENSLRSDTSEGILTDGGYMAISGYTKDMRYQNNEDYDIVAVYLPNFPQRKVCFDGSTEDCKKIWRRPEPIKKTIAELKEYYEATTLREVEIVE